MDYASKSSLVFYIFAFGIIIITIIIILMILTPQWKWHKTHDGSWLTGGQAGTTESPAQRDTNRNRLTRISISLQSAQSSPRPHTGVFDSDRMKLPNWWIEDSSPKTTTTTKREQAATTTPLNNSSEASRARKTHFSSTALMHVISSIVISKARTNYS